jgi:antitoxin YefM
MTTVEAVNITKARQTLFSLIKKTNETHMPVLITGKDGDAVLLSENDWNAIEETLYLNSVPGLVESILEAEREAPNTRINADELEW